MERLIPLILIGNYGRLGASFLNKYQLYKIKELKKVIIELLLLSKYFKLSFKKDVPLSDMQVLTGKISSHISQYLHTDQKETEPSQPAQENSQAGSKTNY